VTDKSFRGAESNGSFEEDDEEEKLLVTQPELGFGLNLTRAPQTGQVDVENLNFLRRQLR
jgi:hypothetical protein